MAAPTPSIEKLLKKLEKEPNSLIFLQLAEEYRKESLYEDALRTCRDGLRRHPNYWSARVAMGRIYHEMGDKEKSREELEKVIKAVPDNLLANKLLGDIYMESDRLTDALKRYQIVQMLTPNDQEVIANLQRIETQLMAASRPEPAPAPRAADPETAEDVPAPTVEEASPAAPPPVDLPEFLEKTAPGVRAAARADAFDATVPQGASSTPDEPVPPPAPDSADLAAMFLESAHAGEVPIPPPFPSPDEDHFPSFAPALAELPSELASAPAEGEAPARTEDRTQPMQGKQEKEDMGDFEGDELTTQTLAELYVQQGLTDKAVKVFQKLLLNDPANQQLQLRLRELSPADTLLSSFGPARDTQSGGAGRGARDASGAASGTLIGTQPDRQAEDRQRKITTLENWLTAIRRERS